MWIILLNITLKESNYYNWAVKLVGARTLDIYINERQKWENFKFKLNFTIHLQVVYGKLLLTVPWLQGAR